MSQNISNFSPNNFLSTVVKGLNNGIRASKTSFKGNLENDCFEKQPDNSSFKNIPAEIVNKAEKFPHIKSFFAKKILKELSQAYESRPNEEKLKDYQYTNIFEALSTESRDKNYKYYKLMSELLRLKKVPINLVDAITFEAVSCHDVNAVIDMAKFLDENENIPSKDVDGILYNVSNKNFVENQKYAINSYLSNNDYDYDNVCFVMNEVKTKKDADLKLSSVDRFKELEKSAKDLFARGYLDRPVSKIVKSVDFLAENKEKLQLDTFDENDFFMLPDIIDLQGVKSLKECSFTQKVELLKFLSKYSIDKKDFGFSEFFPILPRSDKEFNTIFDDVLSALTPNTNAKSKLPKFKIDNLEFGKIVLKDSDYTALDDKSKDILNCAIYCSKSNDIEKSLINCMKLQKIFNISKTDFQKIYTIISQQDYIKDYNESENLYNVMLLRDADTRKLTNIFAKAKAQNIDEARKNEIINEIEKKNDKWAKTDILLPQLTKSDILKVAYDVEMDGYNVKIANSLDIDNFTALIHSTDTGLFADVDNPLNKLRIIKTFEDINNNEVLCCSYIGGEKNGVAGNVGLIMSASPYDIVAASGLDMFSPRKPNLKKISTDFFSNGTLDDENRFFVPNRITDITGITDEKYSEYVSDIIEKSGGKPLSLEKLKEINPEYASKVSDFLKTDSDIANFEKSFLKTTGTFNEVLLRRPSVEAIYVTSLDLLDKNYLKFAQDNNLPIVVLDQ